MNEPSNAPMLSGEPRSMVQTWMNAITKPSEETYARIAASPEAKTSTALLWIFIASLIQSFVVFLMQGVLMSQMMQGSGFENQMGTSLVSVLCGAPVVAVISVVLFAALPVLFSGWLGCLAVEGRLRSWYMCWPRLRSLLH